MADIQEEKEKTPAAAPAEGTTSSQAIAAMTPADMQKLNSVLEVAGSRSAMSKGEKVYNWVVYSGVNYWLNLGMSIFSADFFINNKILSKTPKGQMFGKTISGPGMLNWGAEKMGGLFARMGASPGKAVHHARTALKTSVLCSGGWLLLIPMKLMEDRKRPLVHWLNKKLGVKQVGPDGREETPDQIYIEQEQPPQSWLRVIARRTVAWLSVVATGHVINFTFRDKENSAHYKGEDDKYGGKEVVGDFIVKNINQNILESPYMPGGKWLRGNDTLQRYMHLGALDTLFTKITALVMHKTNGAKALHTKQEISIDCDPVANGETHPSAPQEKGASPGTEVETPERKAPASPAPQEKNAPPETEAPERKYAEGITPASRQPLAPSSSHGDLARRGETNYLTP